MQGTPDLANQIDATRNTGDREWELPRWATHIFYV